MRESNRPIIKMPEYKLIYFDIRALGEPIRWLFLVAGVPFEDQRLQFKDWPKLKSTTGWGKVPVLVVDGKELTQATAIERFLAKRFNLIPEDDFQAAKADEVVNAVNEIVDAWRTYALEKDVEKKAILKENLMKGFLITFLEKINEIVEKNGSGFVAGEKLSWADLVLVNYIEILQDTFDENLFTNFKGLLTLKDTVFAIPEISEWVSKRPKSVL